MAGRDRDRGVSKRTEHGETRMKSWNYVKKRLESEFMAPSLRGRVTYFMTRYDHAHDKAGRVAVRVDGKEILKGSDMSWWIRGTEYEKRVLELFPEIRDLKSQKQREEAVWNAAVDLGCITRCDFYDAYDTFENQSIDDSLNGKNGLVKLFAVLDRRVGKRRLKKLWDEQWGRETVWLLPFLYLRLEAEGIMVPGKESADRASPEGER